MSSQASGVAHSLLPTKENREKGREGGQEGQRKREKEKNLREDWIILSFGEKLRLLKVVNMLIMSAENLQEEKDALFPRMKV